MKDFNKIMGKFNKVVSKLETLSEAKKEERRIVQTKVDDLQLKIKSISAEEVASMEVANKLKSIFTASSSNK